MATLHNPSATADGTEVSTPPTSWFAAFRDAAAAEWLRLRTVRSTYGFLAGAAAATLVGMLILFVLIQAYDQATRAEQANFETADPTVVIMPFVGFFVASIGAMSITIEFTIGTMGATLVAVPQRHVLLAAKAAVVGIVSWLCGLGFALLTVAGATLLLGDRPAPLNPWPNWTDAMPSIFGAALFVLVTGAVALGLGAMLRSTAATLVSLGGLVLVAPIFAHFLPTAWHLRFASILLPNLAPQAAGTDHPYLLSQAGATAVMAVYVVLALGSGALSFTRRDAA